MDNTHEYINARSEPSICRICWETDGSKISPCKCAGSTQYVHHECLKRWFEKGVQQSMLKVKKKDNGISSILCEICKSQICFKGKKTKGCLPSTEIKHRICENIQFFICRFIAQCVYLLVLGILIYKLIEGIIDNKDHIASHVILSVLIGLGIIIYIKLLVPLMVQYCWGQDILEIQFLEYKRESLISTNNSQSHKKIRKMQEECYES